MRKREEENEVEERKIMVEEKVEKRMNKSSKDRTWSAVHDALLEVIS